MIKYFDNTELGKSPEISSLVSPTRQWNIGAIDYAAFNNLSEFTSNKIGGK